MRETLKFEFIYLEMCEYNGHSQTIEYDIF
jgi:hypothetical protein